MLRDLQRDGTTGAPAPPRAKLSHSVRADAGAQRRNPDLIDLLFVCCAQALAEATREDLHLLARDLARLDRDRARTLAMLIHWELSGEVIRELRNDALSWLFTATPQEIDAIGARMVALTTPGASMLASSIFQALEKRGQTLLR